MFVTLVDQTEVEEFLVYTESTAGQIYKAARVVGLASGELNLRLASRRFTLQHETNTHACSRIRVIIERLPLSVCP